MPQIIIVTGHENVADKTSSTGWRTRAYARVVDQVADIGDQETVWTGDLRWSNADPEGRFEVAWVGPHGLRIADREHGNAIARARKAVVNMRAAIELAEDGHVTQVWDKDAQAWVDVRTPASEDELAAGLAAMDAIDDARARLDSAMTRQIDGSTAAAELAALRAKRAAEKAAQAAAGAVDALPNSMQELVWALQRKRPSMSVGVKMDGDLMWDGGFGYKSAAMYQIKPHLAALRPHFDTWLASETDAARATAVRKFLGAAI